MHNKWAAYMFFGTSDYFLYLAVNQTINIFGQLTVFILNYTLSQRLMFKNQLLTLSLSLNQQQPQNQASQSQQNQFPLDQYISQPNYTNYHDQPQISISSYQQTQQDHSYVDHEAIDQLQVTTENESELQFLKQHLATIETIALREIQLLKCQLEREIHLKQALKRQIDTIKHERSDIKQFPSDRFSQHPIDQNQVVVLLKEENKMLKQALKKQLHINKNLIKSSINHPYESSTHLTQQQTNNKQNLDPNANNQLKPQSDTHKPTPYDRPTIPHPKRISLT